MGHRWLIFNHSLEVFDEKPVASGPAGLLNPGKSSLLSLSRRRHGDSLQGGILIEARRRGRWPSGLLWFREAGDGPRSLRLHPQARDELQFFIREGLDVEDRENRKIILISGLRARVKCKKI